MMESLDHQMYYLELLKCKVKKRKKKNKNELTWDEKKKSET